MPMGGGIFKNLQSGGGYYLVPKSIIYDISYSVKYNMIYN